MKLSSQILGVIQKKRGEKSFSEIMQLPEKVLQFGTGVLLRGLPDVYIDLANKQNIFNGRIVVVKSTDSGGADAFAKQDGLYTVLIRGFENGKQVDTNMVNASISRVLSASSEWDAILACAENPQMQLVISNTTEVGISLVEELIQANPPVSFPGKLLAFLYRRYQFFNGAMDAGMVIVPTELISENGHKLKSILLALSTFNQMDAAFINWLDNANDFCNSLVDRIVPGKLNAIEQQQVSNQLGYEDDLMIMCEPYSLWAIETKKGKTRELLSFSRVNEEVKITGDISKYKELKLRLLNATHSFSCALAMFCGFQSVKEAMSTEYFRKYVLLLMLNEIKPLVVSETITDKEAELFAQQVIDRFRNNSIEHLWVNISMQYTMKMAMRCVPLMAKNYEQNKPTPKLMLLGFAAYLLLLKTEQNANGSFSAVIGKKQIPLTDEKAPVLYQHWQNETVKICIAGILKEAKIWNINLLQFHNFESDLLNCVMELQEIPAPTILQHLIPQKQRNEK